MHSVSVKASEMTGQELSETRGKPFAQTSAYDSTGINRHE